MIMLEQAGAPNVMTSTWLCDTPEEINEIPENVPVGSVALVLTSDGLAVQMKNNAGEWIEI